MARMIDCIYCCKAGAYSREHVLQKSLGGNLTAPVACDACNHGFSRIDQALAEQSMVALDRTLHTPVQHPVRLGNLHFMHRPDIDLWEEVQLTNQFVPRVPAQLHFREPNVWFFADGNENKTCFALLLKKRIADGTMRRIPIRVAPTKFCTTVRLVQHRRADMLFALARSKMAGHSSTASLRCGMT